MQIKLQQFEGPLDVLLGMIEENELDITEVSLAQVADQYVEYIEHARDIEPEEVANFLVVAARLLWIKSKVLLPYLIPEEEHEEIKDFEHQLTIYRDFLEVSKHIEALLGRGKFMYARSMVHVQPRDAAFNPPPRVTVQVLHSAYQDIVRRLRPREMLAEEQVTRTVSIEERIGAIREALQKMKHVAFSTLVDANAGRGDVVVSFIAMLELVKQKKVSAEQKTLFAEIYLQQLS